MKITDLELKSRYAWPLERKIEESVNRIIDWYSSHQGKVSVSVSGGLDSTVLLHLVRVKAEYPNVPAVFSNTRLEFPENVQFVKTFENVHIVRPKKNFRQVISEYGYPVVSKRVAQYIGEVQRSKGNTATRRLRMTGIKTDGTTTRIGEISTVWKSLVNCGFKISDRCCHYLKKEPLRRAETLYGAPFVGTRAMESQQRELTYKQYGCNAYNIKSPRSTPMAFWSSDDVKNYIAQEKIPYSKLYDMGYERSGCMWCMFGAHREEDIRFELLEQTHPKIFAYCRDKLKIFDVLDVVKELWNARHKKNADPRQIVMDFEELNK